MEELKIKYRFDEKYNPDYINGAMAGLNPTGEIFLNFYLERRPLPKSATIRLINGIPTDEVIEVSPEDYQNSIIRYIENGVIMNYSVAKEIHRLLGEQLGKFVTENNSK